MALSHVLMNGTLTLLMGENFTLMHGVRENKQKIAVFM